MSKKTIFILLLLFMFGTLGFSLGQLENMKRNLLLSKEFYYELPSDGYIYINEEYVRFNENSFNGTLDYQITLNYKFVDQEKEASRWSNK